MTPSPSPRTRHAQGGFTWAEFALVAACLTGMLLVAVFAVNGIRDDTRESNCQDAKRFLMTATYQYHAANDSYPVNKDVLIDSGLVDADDVSGWSVEFAAGATEPTFVPSGSCI